MISCDIQPLSIVNDPGFLQYSFTLEPKFLVPSRTTVENEVSSLFEEKKAEIINTIQNQISWFCITFDIWTSRCQDGYISLTVHYIDKKSWQMTDLRLGAYLFQGRHGASEIAEKVTELLEEWQLPLDKLCGVTCDNASNNVKCLREHLCVPRAPCLGHVLNLSVQDALKVRGVAEAIARCRKLVEHFDKSRTAAELLRSKQISMNMKGHKLIQDVPTRWNSTFAMIERLLEQKTAVTAVVRESLQHENSPMPTYMPNENEWRIVQQITLLLQPSLDITTWISSSSYFTICAAGPSIAVLKHALLNCVCSRYPTIRRFKETAQAKIDNISTTLMRRNS